MLLRRCGELSNTVGVFKERFVVEVGPESIFGGSCSDIGLACQVEMQPSEASSSPAARNLAALRSRFASFHSLGDHLHRGLRRYYARRPTALQVADRLVEWR